MESRTEFKIKSPPTDAISAVEFGPNSTQFLLVSSWDSTVRLYDIHANTMRLKYNHDLPVLDVAFQVITNLSNILVLYKFLYIHKINKLESIIVISNDMLYLYI